MHGGRVGRGGGCVSIQAPEVVQNVGHGKPVDYWALGCLIFEMLAGTAPFYKRGVGAKTFERCVPHPWHWQQSSLSNL